MKNKRPVSGTGIKSLKSAGNNVISSKNETKSHILMRDISTTPGNGLWCVNIEKNKARKENVTTAIPTSMNSDLRTNPNFDIEQEFEKKIIDTLKFQVRDLTKKLQISMDKCAEAEYMANRAENNKITYTEVMEKKCSEMNDLEDKVDNLENTIINLNEALSNAKKEIVRLQNENNIEIEKNKNYYEMYQNLIIEKERRESAMSSEVNSLMNKIQNERNEKENLIRLMKNQEKNNEVVNNHHKANEEKENIYRMNEGQMNKLINENAEIKRRLTVEEGNKYKLNEIIKKKKDKIKALKDELKSYKDAIGSYGNDVKWNQDLVAQRDSQIKVFKDKIKKLEEENKKLINKVEVIKKRRMSKDVQGMNNDEEVVHQVKAKPFLFGPEKDEMN